jgi:hypothetical protein
MVYIMVKMPNTDIFHGEIPPGSGEKENDIME